MDLKQLSNLIHVVELQSFSKAAAFLRIAQPALSRQVKSLEEELGVALLERHGWGVTATAEGQILVEHARKLMRGVQEAREAVLALQAEPQGEVTLGVPTSVGAAMVPDLVQQFRQACPKVSLRLVEGFSASVHEWLLAGRLDLAILYETRETIAIGAEPLLRENMVLVGAARKLSGGALPLAEVARLPLILSGRPHRLRLLVDSAFTEARLEVRPVIEADALSLMKELAHRDEGYTILPYSAVQAEVRDGKLSVSPIAAPGIVRVLVVGQRPDRRGTPAMAALDAHLRRLVLSQAAAMRWTPLSRGQVGQGNSSETRVPASGALVTE